MAELNLVRGELPGCLADVPDNTYHALMMDGPYMLESNVDTAALLKFWLGLGPEPGNRGGMLGRQWDRIPPPQAWREYLRVLRPGGPCFAYSHARTYHLQAIAMELAGFRLLPMIVRIHGSAMALGHAVGKAIDKAAGAEREIVGESVFANRSGEVPSMKIASMDAPHGFVGREKAPRMITAPATPLAALFDGFNSALKNQIETIVVAVKPPDGTWAENAAKWGTGCFNVQAGRVPSGRDHAKKYAAAMDKGGQKAPTGTRTGGKWGTRSPETNNFNPAGRFPSNVVLSHEPDCGADWCVPGCAVRELGDRSARRDAGKTCGIGDSGNASRFFWQSRAAARERAAGCEHLLWRRAPKHPDGWELVDRETWERLGDEAAEKAMDSGGYRERMAEGYKRDENIRTPLGGKRLRRDGFRMPPGGPRRQVLDVDRLDAAAYLDAARARVRTTGSPHLAVKALDGGAYLAKLLLQPVVNGVEPILGVFYAGTGSETIGAMLGGWTRIDAFESSAQWNVVHEARFAYWRDLIARVGRGKALELLREAGTAPGEDPEAEPEVEQLSLFDDDELDELAERLRESRPDMI